MQCTYQPQMQIRLILNSKHQPSLWRLCKCGASGDCMLSTTRVITLCVYIGFHRYSRICVPVPCVEAGSQFRRTQEVIHATLLCSPHASCAPRQTVSKLESYISDTCVRPLYVPCLFLFCIYLYIQAAAKRKTSNKSRPMFAYLQVGLVLHGNMDIGAYR